jgi:hypothetical protein
MPYDKFNIIKFKGDPNTVTLVDGTKIQNDRRDFIFVPEYGAMIRVVRYGSHFLFEVPKRIRGPSYLCSCGAAGIMVGSKAYAHLGSPEGMMLVCSFHTQFNRHADGSS